MDIQGVLSQEEEEWFRRCRTPEDLLALLQRIARSGRGVNVEGTVRGKALTARFTPKRAYFRVDGEWVEGVYPISVAAFRLTLFHSLLEGAVEGRKGVSIICLPYPDYC